LQGGGALYAASLVRSACPAFLCARMRHAALGRRLRGQIWIHANTDRWIDWLPLSQLCRERAVVVHRYHAPLRVLLLHPAQPDCLGARLAQHLVRPLPAAPRFASRLRRTPSSPAASTRRTCSSMAARAYNVARARKRDELDSATTARRSRAQAQTIDAASNAHPHDFKKVVEQPDDVPKQAGTRRCTSYDLVLAAFGSAHGRESAAVSTLWRDRPARTHARAHHARPHSAELLPVPPIEVCECICRLTAVEPIVIRICIRL
jgi:hypothetical protein